jgi:hypothetical protein
LRFEIDYAFKHEDVDLIEMKNGDVDFNLG